MSIKGYPGQGKLDRLKPGIEFATVEPVLLQQSGLSVAAHVFMYSVGTDAVEASSTASVISATAHAAQRGDVIRFTSGTSSGREVRVYSVTTNTITLVEDLSAAPAALDTFQILRDKAAVINSDGSIPVTPSAAGAIQFMRDAVVTTVTEDTVTPANNRPLPVKLTGITGDITVTAQNLNIQSTHTGANPDSMQIGDGTDLLAITAAGEANVLATAQPGVDIGDVTVNNAAGASAVNIQDGGNSITVDGTVAISGSVTVTATDLDIRDLSSATDSVSAVVTSSALPTGAATSANQTNKAQFTRITDGTDDAGVTGAGELNVLSTAQPGVDIGDVTVNNAAGASAVNIQDGGNSITVDGTVAVSGGTIAVTATDLDIRDLSSATDSVSAVVTSSALPTGASTSANQTNKAQFTRITDGTDDATVTGAGELNVLATAQPGVDIGDVTVNNAAGASAVNIQDGGNSITIDGTVAATQSGTWSNRITDGTDIALVTGAGELNVLATAQPGVDIGDVTINNAAGASAVNIQDGGNSITVDGTVSANFASVTLTEFVRNDYSSVNVTTAAYVQLIASTTNTYEELEIFDSSGQTLKLATGAAAAEVDRLLIFPGGNGRIRYRVPSGTRISIRAVSATANTGEISINWYG